MNQGAFLANAVLWAAAIIASALVGAPVYFTIVLLPALATSALMVTRTRRRATGCDI